MLLFHKRPVVLVSSVNSVAFNTALGERGFTASMTKSERANLAMAAVPILADDLVFGDTTSFEIVILPVYVPGHYVSRKS